MSLRKRFAFSILTCFAMVAALELTLTVFGVRPLLYDEDPFVGFTTQVDLFVEATESDGRIFRETAGHHPHRSGPAPPRLPRPGQLCRSGWLRGSRPGLLCRPQSVSRSGRLRHRPPPQLCWQERVQG